jgi:hypothetical protein
VDDQAARDDIAFIRRTLEEGRNYARGRSADFLVWGIAVACGYMATYAFVRHWSAIEPDWVWPVLLGLPWLYSLRRVFRRLSEATAESRPPMAQAMAMLWLACGLFLTTLAFGAGWFGVIHQAWFDPTIAGVMGIGFFASASLCNLSWMRLVGLGWWAGEIVLFALHGRSEQLLVAAALMLVLLAGPGLVIIRGRAGA